MFILTVNCNSSFVEVFAKDSINDLALVVNEFYYKDVASTQPILKEEMYNVLIFLLTNVDKCRINYAKLQLKNSHLQLIHV